MDREAVTAPIAMSVAFSIFLVAFGAVALKSSSVGDGSAGNEADAAYLSAKAGNLLDVMLQSPGYSTGGLDWISPEGQSGREDTITRLGLRNAAGSGLSFEKFENLRLAPYSDDGTGDGFVNYEDARAALGLESEGLGFHIRAKPSLKSVQQILESGERDPNLKVTYLGDSTGDGDDPSLTPPSVSAPTCTLDGSGKTYTLAATVENTGTQPTQFSAFITIDPPSGSKRTEWAHGPIVAASGTTVLQTTVPVDKDYCKASAKITFDVWDPSQRWATATTTIAIDVGGTEHTRDLIIDASKSQYTEGATVVLAYDGTGLGNNDALAFTLLNETLAVVTGPHGFTAGNNNLRSIQVGDVTAGTRAFNTGGPLPAGSYTATLTDGTVTVTEQVHIFASGSEPGNFAASGASGTSGLTAGAITEITFLHDLVERFCPFEYDDSATKLVPDRTGDPSPTHTERCSFSPRFQDGDVIPDQKDVMNDELPLRLLDANGDPTFTYVTMLVVGSNVDHQVMTSASAKHAVRDWVLGGGTLVVFGSSEQTVQWLQPIFHAGIQSSSGGVATPDADHPLLVVSDTLDYDGYSSHGKVWDLKESGGSSSADKFTDVVEDGAGDAILTISDPGAYGKGTVILSTWMPYDLFGDGSDPGLEGAKLTNNILMQGYRGLFLDYGPSLPSGQLVVPASGKAQIFHPELNRLVSLDITLFVFKQS